jgi:hypothetical protein
LLHEKKVFSNRNIPEPSCPLKHVFANEEPLISIRKPEAARAKIHQGFNGPCQGFLKVGSELESAQDHVAAQERFEDAIDVTFRQKRICVKE